WSRRKRLSFSFLGTLAALVLTSQLILPGWFIGWWRSLVDYSSYTLPPLTQLVLGYVVGAATGLALLVLAATVCWRVRRQPASSAGFCLAVSFVLAVTVVVAPTGGAVYDQIILLPAIVWLGFRRAEVLKAGLPM